jgi:hypothetical protein
LGAAYLSVDLKDLILKMTGVLEFLLIINLMNIILGTRVQLILAEYQQTILPYQQVHLQDLALVGQQQMKTLKKIID